MPELLKRVYRYHFYSKIMLKKQWMGMRETPAGRKHSPRIIPLKPQTWSVNFVSVIYLKKGKFYENINSYIYTLFSGFEMVAQRRETLPSLPVNGEFLFSIIHLLMPTVCKLRSNWLKGIRFYLISNETMCRQAGA